VPLVPPSAYFFISPSACLVPDHKLVEVWAGRQFRYGETMWFVVAVDVVKVIVTELVVVVVVMEVVVVGIVVVVWSSIVHRH
jgi:hypothetical protein